MGEVVVEAEEEMVPMVGSFFLFLSSEKARKGMELFFVILVNSVNCFFLLLVFLCVWCPSLGNEPNGMVCRVDGVCEIED